ncbi:MAG: YXWGXW repeat-containing protein [Bacteroidetes bacterium]|nr:YXWGXW repeat-containing protein [Bacteroidota bacterium]
MKNLAKIISLMAAVTLMAITKANAQVNVSVGIEAGIAPPVLPVYAQPACPVDGYIWQPGYWAWDPDEGDYYWVPGVWVAPPSFGVYWTPSYWGFDGGVYVFHAGYWGPEVGFYGGINYGYGYYGRGFCGGGWSGNHFRYNTAVWHVNRTVIHNTYIDRTVVRRNTIVNNHVAYNGGHGGVMARPTPAQRIAMNQRHIPATSAQRDHQLAAVKDRSQFAKVNHGRPGLTSMRRVDPQQFRQRANTAANRTSTSSHAGRMQSNVRQQSRTVHNNAARQIEARHSQQQYQAQHNQQRVQQQHYQAQRYQQRAQQQRYQAQRYQQPRMQQRPQQQRDLRVQRMETPQRMQQPRMQPQRMQPQHMQPQRAPQPQRERHR